MEIEDETDRKIPKNIKWLIVSMKILNYKPKDIIWEIAQLFNNNIYRSTIKWVWDLYNQTGDVKRRKGSGKKEAFPEEKKEKILEFVSNNPFSGPKAIEKNSELNPKQISHHTIRRIFRKNNIIAKRANPSKMLNEKQFEDRLNFAKKHKEWTINNWKKVGFSDESDLFPRNTSQQYAFIKKGKPFPPYDTKNYQTYNVKCWGIIYKGQLFITKYEGNLNAKSYVDLLDEVLFNFAPNLKNQNTKARPEYFMQDNAPSHSSKITTKWLEEKGVVTLDWPARSPDINIIENVWSCIKDKLWIYKDNIKNKDDTWKYIQKIVENFEENFIEKLYESLPKRVNELEQKEGGRIPH